MTEQESVDVKQDVGKTMVLGSFDYMSINDVETQELLKQRAEAGRVLLKRTARGVWEIGQLLSEVKARVDHGQFGKWIEAELGLTYRAVLNFLRVFENFKCEMISDLNVAPTVLYELSKPSVSDTTRALATEQMKSGALKSVSDARTMARQVECALQVSKVVNLFHTCGKRRGHPDAKQYSGCTADDLFAAFVTNSPDEDTAMWAFETFYNIYPRWQFIKNGFCGDYTQAPMSDGQRTFETEQLLVLCAQAWESIPMDQLMTSIEALRE